VPFVPPPEIALVAAVPMETGLLRERLALCAPHNHDLPCWQGQLGTRRVMLIHCGVGKANAAAHTTLLLERFAPQRVLHFGCAGAYPGSGLHIGDLALADAEIFGDDGALTPEGFLGLDDLGLPLHEAHGQPCFQRIPLGTPHPEVPARLQGFATDTGSRFASGTFVTVSTCSGSDTQAAVMARRTGGLCESMEGAAVALACLLRGTPCTEIRGISNLAEDRDLSRWNLAAGCRIAQLGVLELLELAPECLP